MNAQNTITLDNNITLSEFSEMKVEFLQALVKGKTKLCTSLMQSYLDRNISIQQLYENVFKDALYDVGELWEYNKISVATEHMASAIVETLMNQLYPQILANFTKEKTIVTSCVQNEMHQIGIRMISDVFEMNGWDALFLGADTPNNELIKFLEEHNPQVFAVSVSLSFNVPNVIKIVEQVHAQFPQITILVGGQAFSHGYEEVFEGYENVFIKSDIESIELFIKNY